MKDDLLEKRVQIPTFFTGVCDAANVPVSLAENETVTECFWAAVRINLRKSLVS